MVNADEAAEAEGRKPRARRGIKAKSDREAEAGEVARGPAYARRRGGGGGIEVDKYSDVDKIVMASGLSNEKTRGGCIVLTLDIPVRKCKYCIVLYCIDAGNKVTLRLSTDRQSPCM